MEANGKPRIWVNRIVAFLGGGLLMLIVLSIAVMSPASTRSKELATRLDTIQNGAPRLLAEAKASLAAKDYVSALKTLAVLSVQQPTSPEAAEGAKLSASIEAAIHESDQKWAAAMVSIKKAWELTTAAQLRAQAISQAENAMADTLSKEWDSAKDQIRREWENRQL